MKIFDEKERKVIMLKVVKSKDETRVFTCHAEILAVLTLKSIKTEALTGKRIELSLVLSQYTLNIYNCSTWNKNLPFKKHI